MAPFETLGPLLADAAPARLFDESLKMFLSGNGLKSFRMLEHCGLLKFLFPATARALKRGDEALRSLVEHGLANTDARIAEGKSVTPAFLFAVLLWGEVRDVAQQLIAPRRRTAPRPGRAPRPRWSASSASAWRSRAGSPSPWKRSGRCSRVSSRSSASAYSA